MTAAWMPFSPVMLPLVATPYVPQASCLTTEPLRRSSTLALGLSASSSGGQKPTGELSRPGAATP